MKAADPSPTRIGVVTPRSASEITSSSWSIGGETLDRDFAKYDSFKAYLGPLGAKGLRLQAGWAKCERTRGAYEWAWLDAIVDDARSRGVQPWLQTSYGNTIYKQGGGTGLGGGFPKSVEALNAWDNWVRALVHHFRDRVHEWEIWNEPDLGKGNSPEDYASLFIRTAEIIRAEQPKGRIYALALAGSASFADKFLAQMASRKKLELIDAITFHGYPHNPDDMWMVDRLRAAVLKTGRAIELRQGEMGAPSQYQENFALSKLPWSEVTQAKWNVRRMLAHHGKDVPFNLFTICDLQYRSGTNVQMNYKGLLSTNPDQSVSRPKLAYRAAQHVFSIFDNTLVRMTNFTCTASITNALAAYAFTNRTTGAAYVAVWFKGAPPVDTNVSTAADLTLGGVSFKEPVCIDLLTGNVDRLSGSAGATLKQVPLYDSPLVVTERSEERLWSAQR